MDPTAAANANVDTAMLLALALGLVEVIKQLVRWATQKISKKGNNHTTLLVQLDPEVSKIIHETHGQVDNISAVVSRVDADGVPLIYTDRHLERNVEKIAEVLRDVSDIQRKLAEALDRLDARLEQHMKEDAVMFDRLERSAEMGVANIADLRRQSDSNFHRLEQLVVAHKK